MKQSASRTDEYPQFDQPYFVSMGDFLEEFALPNDPSNHYKLDQTVEQDNEKLNYSENVEVSKDGSDIGDDKKESGAEDIIEQSAVHTNPQLSRIPLWRVVGRSTLNISTSPEQQMAYDRVYKGSASETKTLKTYYDRQMKHLQCSSTFHMRLKEDQIKDIHSFSNNFAGIRRFYGFSPAADGTIEEAARDNSRREGLAYCRLAGASIMYSASNFSSKLYQVKYLKDIELSVLEPQKFYSWKSG